MKKYITCLLLSMVVFLCFPIMVESKGNTKGQFIEDITDEESLMSFALYIPANAKCNNLIFVFHGVGESGDDCNCLPLYAYVKYGYYDADSYICFVKKEKGSWAQFDRNTLSLFINRVVDYTCAKNVHFIGYSQGAYDAWYISNCYKSWSNALLVDGGGDTSWVKDKFKYSIWIAGYDTKSYDKAEDFNEYYEPVDVETFTSKKKYHLAAAVIAFSNEKTLKFYDREYASYYAFSYYDGVSKLLEQH